MRGGIDPDLLREMRHFLQTVRVSLEDGDRTVALIRPADTRAVTGLLGVLDDLERREVVDPDGPAGPILLWGTWGGGPEQEIALRQSRLQSDLEQQAARDGVCTEETPILIGDQVILRALLAVLGELAEWRDGRRTAPLPIDRDEEPLHRVPDDLQFVTTGVWCDGAQEFQKVIRGDYLVTLIEHRRGRGWRYQWPGSGAWSRYCPTRDEAVAAFWHRLMTSKAEWARWFQAPPAATAGGGA